MTDLSGWAAILNLPRVPAASLRGRDIPSGPGVYSWYHDGHCVYVGMATSLRQRLGAHRRQSVDLSRSTLRASVAVRELGVTRAQARSRPSVMTNEQIEVVNAWLRGCEIAWVECATAREADELERRLRKEWMPPINLA